MDFGIRFARKFLDAREVENDARSEMNLHNNQVGRKVRIFFMLTKIKVDVNKNMYENKCVFVLVVEDNISSE